MSTKQERSPRVYGDVITINVDIQNDFALPDGALSVPDGESVIQPLNAVNRWTREKLGQVVFTRDWHPNETPHFVDQGGIWPRHCVHHTAGAAFPDNLIIEREDVIASKGMGQDDGYSGWDAYLDESPMKGMHIDDYYFTRDAVNKVQHIANFQHSWRQHPITGNSSPGIYMSMEKEHGYYEMRNRTAILIGGLATDYCVRATVLQALNGPQDYPYEESLSSDKNGLDVYLIEDAIKSVDITPGDGDRAIAEMLAAGAHRITSEEIISGKLVIDRQRLEM